MYLPPAEKASGAAIVICPGGGYGGLAPHEGDHYARWLNELGIAGFVTVGVAKGADRRVGQERMFLAGRDTPLILNADSAALRLIQRVRNEAHRFAIAGHRARRAKARSRASLEDIPGVGPAKRKRLLAQFGGLQGVRSATVEDLCRVEGISRKLAEEIYKQLH